MKKKKKSSRLIENADLVEELKKAINDNDADLLEEILSALPALSGHKMNKEKNI
jgi:hypothetical protein